MKKIVSRRKRLRINSPLSFGILCGVLLLVLCGAAFGLSKGVIVPLVKNIRGTAAAKTEVEAEPLLLQTPVPEEMLTEEPEPEETPDTEATPEPVVTPEPTPEPTPTPEPKGRLEGRVIAIDAAKSKNASKYKGVSTGVKEYIVNYRIAAAVKSILEEEGATVVMTRTSEDENVETDERIKIINNSNAEVAVSIMCNYIDAGSTRGCQMIVSSKHKQLASCKTLADCVLSSYTSTTDMPARKQGDSAIRQMNNWTLLNGVKVPAASIIVGHLSNKTDDKSLNDSAFVTLAAKGIANGIMNYFNH